MSWDQIQIKYQLIHVSEILLNWAKFKSPRLLPRLDQIREAVFTQSLKAEDLLVLKDELVAIINTSGDPLLVRDMNNFVSEYANHESKESGVEST